MAERTKNTKILPAPAPRRVLVLVPPDSQLVGVLGLVEAFDAANRWLAGAGRPPLYDLHVVGLERRAAAASGVCLETEPVDGFDDAHTLVVGGALHGFQPEAVAQVRRLAPRTERLVSICAGAFVLGEAGLLDGRRCTTHWLALERLRARFPAARVKDDALYTEDGNVFTSAGATAGIDLALHLLRRDRSDRLALAVARSLVVFASRPGGQSQFGAPLRLGPGLDERLRRLVAEIVRNPAADHTVEAMARSVGMSPRNFARVFREQSRDTPAAFVRRARVEAAQRLLSEDRHGLAEVAAACGLGCEDTLRRAFLEVTGVTPGAWRHRFAGVGATPSDKG